MIHKQIEADFLIIGGGSAGCMAAIRALEENPSLRVVIFEKSDLKYGGSIARGMDALNIVVIPNFTTADLYVEAMTIACDGMDQEEVAQAIIRLLPPDYPH
jgi:succinate dehydrogenase/fumarate reductase flavoprotein subunit